jgi:hypothetical protein
MTECLHRMAKYLNRMVEYLHRMTESFCRVTEYLHRMVEPFCRMTNNLLIKLQDFLCTSGVCLLTSFSGSHNNKIYNQMLYKRPLYGDTI